MARHVKITTVGAERLGFPEGLSNQCMVERMRLYWHDYFDKIMCDKPDLVVVPEHCDIPTNILPGEKRLAYYKERGWEIVELFKATAKKNRCYIVYTSNLFMDDGILRNVALMIDRTGEIIGHYNKYHLTPDEYDVEGVLYGNEVRAIDCDFGRVCFAICFDLNFDDIRMKCKKLRPDLILFPSLYHGGMMQAYWAYSCQSHFVGAVAGLPAEIRNPLGEVIASSTNYTDFVTANINLDCCLVKNDSMRPDTGLKLKQKYGADVDITTPAYMGVTLITSNTDKLSAKDICSNFSLPLLDDFFISTINHRKNVLAGKEKNSGKE